MVKVVFDIGGTNMRVAEAADGALKQVVKVPTPRGADEGIEVLLDTISKVSGDRDVEAVAGGFAGVIGKDSVIMRSHNLPGWGGLEIGARIRERVSENVVVRNDGDLAGLAEAVRGAGEGKRIVVYVGIGTGVAGTRIVGGRPDESTYGFEPGHMILGLTKMESLEHMVSGRNLEEKYGKRPSELGRDVYDSLSLILATGIYNIILLWSPDVVVLGGSLINDNNGFNIARIREEIGRLPQEFPAMPEILQAELGDEAGLYGAMEMLKTIV